MRMELPTSDDIHPWADAAREVIRTLLGVAATIEHEPPGRRAWDAPVRGVVPMAGSGGGAVRLTLEAETARRIDAMITGCPASADVRDVAAELANMITGCGLAVSGDLMAEPGVARSEVGEAAREHAHGFTVRMDLGELVVEIPGGLVERGGERCAC